MTEPDHPDRQREAASAVWMLALGQTLAWAALFYSFAALLLHWERDTGWSKADLALAFTGAVLVSAAGAPLAGRLIDLGHGRLLLALGPAVGAVALAGLCLAATPAAFAVLWLVVGAAQAACLYEACFALVTHRLGAAARPAILRITLVAGFAGPLAFLLGGALAEATGWRAALIGLAALALFGAAPLNWIGAGRLGAGAAPREGAPRARPLATAPLGRALARPAFWLIGAAFTCVAINHGLLINHVVPLLVDRGHAGTTAAVAAALIGPMQVAGRLVLLPVEGRVSSRSVTLAAGVGLVLASAVLLGAGGAAAAAFAFATLQGAAHGLTSVTRPALTAETLGRAGFGTVSGWLAVPYLVGFAVAPTLGALLWDAGGYDLAIAAALAAGMAALLCIAALPRPR